MKNQTKWNRIAKAYYTISRNRTRKQGTIARSGLCRAMYILDVACSEEDAFFKYLWHIQKGLVGDYWLPRKSIFNSIENLHLREHDFIRGDFATLMSLCWDEVVESIEEQNDNT